MSTRKEILKIRLSTEEMNQLRRKANKANETISDYVRKTILDNRDILTASDYIEQAKERIKELEGGQEFTLKELFHFEWNNISKSLKLSLGRLFIKKVKDHEIDNVDILGKTPTHTQIYKKIK